MINKVLGSRTPTKNPSVTEHALSVNDFGQPLVLSNQDAIAVKLIELLLLKPGTYPTRPNMGVGLVENYRYSFFDQMDTLQSEIEDQIRTYLPEFQTTDVTLSGNELTKELLITITVEGLTYALVLDGEHRTLSYLQA